MPQTNQNFFYFCKHKNKDILMETGKIEITPLEGGNSLFSTTFRCPICHHEFIVKMSIADMTSVLKSFGAKGVEAAASEPKAFYAR